MKQFFFFTAIIALTACAAPEKPHWYKGNTHTHTTFSDGDTDFKTVAKWYNDNGYHFLFVTDHNYPSKPDSIPLGFAKRPDFMLMPGNEVTDLYSIHTNALYTTSAIPIGNYLKNRGMSDEEFRAMPGVRAGIIDNHVKSIIAAGGIPILNHPNFSNGVQIADILPVKALKHVELFNGHPQVFYWGKENHSAVEVKWDSILIQGHLMYGIASDDLHQLQKTGWDFANPGRGWIMVNAASLTTENIKNGIESGNFYASTGVFIQAYNTEKNMIRVVVDEKATQNEIKAGRGYPRKDISGVSPGFTIDFVGYNGKILKSIPSLKASYKIQPTDQYVRVRVSYHIDQGGSFDTYYAWTQPVEATKGFFK